jgi:carbon monoxide dehydrogenase subunit G
MADFRVSEIIHCPIEEVFSYLSNLENATNLLPFVTDMEKLSNGPVGHGSCFLETRLVRRRSIQSEIHITEFNRPTAFTSKSISNGVEILYHYTFSAIEEGTQIEMEAKVRTGGFLSFLTKKQLVKIIKNEDGGQLKKLKEVLEAEKVHI